MTKLKMRKTSNLEHVLRDYDYYDKRYGCKFARAQRSRTHSRRKMRYRKG